MPINFRTAAPQRLPRAGRVAVAVLVALGCTGVAWGQGIEARVVQMQGDVRVNGAAARAGGHAVLFRGHDKSAGAFAAPAPAMARLQRELQRAFDPDGIFNPSRLLPAP